MAADTNFMDFSDAGASGARALSRPHLSTEKQTTYEDTGRSAHSLREMHRFYRDERLCDVVIRGDHGARFPCHRLVLAASSLYFESMFSNDMSEARSTEITIKDVSGHALKVGYMLLLTENPTKFYSVKNGNSIANRWGFFLVEDTTLLDIRR